MIEKMPSSAVTVIKENARKFGGHAHVIGGRPVVKHIGQ